MRSLWPAPCTVALALAAARDEIAVARKLIKGNLRYRATRGTSGANVLLTVLHKLVVNEGEWMGDGMVEVSL